MADMRLPAGPISPTSPSFWWKEREGRERERDVCIYNPVAGVTGQTSEFHEHGI